MARKEQKLGRQLLATVDDVTALIINTNDPDQSRVLSKKRAELLDQLSELVEKIIDTDSDDYKAATAGLQEASAMIKQAIKGMESVAKAIGLITKAVDLVTQVIP